VPTDCTKKEASVITYFSPDKFSNTKTFLCNKKGVRGSYYGVERERERERVYFYKVM
jgi:hypothetical protein